MAIAVLGDYIANAVSLIGSRRQKSMPQSFALWPDCDALGESRFTAKVGGGVIPEHRTYGELAGISVNL